MMEQYMNKCYSPAKFAIAQQIMGTRASWAGANALLQNALMHTGNSKIAPNDANTKLSPMDKGGLPSAKAMAIWTTNVQNLDFDYANLQSQLQTAP